MAFTAAVTSRLGECGSKVEYARWYALKKLGMNFQKAFPQQKIIFNEITSKDYNPPVYYQGILFANGDRKGEVIAPFLAYMDFIPRVFIMVYDSKSNLEAIAAALNEFDPTIQFVGIEYRGAQQYAPKTISKEEFTKFWQRMAHSAKAKTIDTRR